MINRLQSTLRLSSLKDMLVYKVNLSPQTAAWMAPLARDVARAQGVELLEFRGVELLGNGLSALLNSEHAAVLAKLAEHNTRLADYLEALNGGESLAQAA